MVRSRRVKLLAVGLFAVAAVWLVWPDVVRHAALTIAFLGLGMVLLLLGLYLAGAGPAIGIVFGVLRAVVDGLRSVVGMLESRRSSTPKRAQVDIARPMFPEPRPITKKLRAKPVVGDGPRDATTRQDRRRRPHLRLIVDNSATDRAPDSLLDEEDFWRIYEMPFKEMAAADATEWVDAAAAARLVLYKPLTKNGKTVADKDYGVLRDDAVWRPGSWRGVSAALIRERGLPVMTLQQVVSELGPTLWRAETEGDLLDAGLVMLASKARITTRVETWDERTVRLFAADCAEHVVPVFERRHPEERRVRDWITLARRAAEGLASSSEVEAARRDALALFEELQDEAGEVPYADFAVDAAAWALGRPAWRDAQEASMAGTCAAAFAAVPGWIRRDEDAAIGRAAYQAEQAWQAIRLGELLGIQ